MITGYYIRNSAGAWALVEQDEQYRETVVADGLTSEDATVLYWQKMAALGGAPAARGKLVRSRKRRPQLLLDL